MTRTFGMLMAGAAGLVLVGGVAFAQAVERDGQRGMAFARMMGDGDHGDRGERRGERYVHRGDGGRWGEDMQGAERMRMFLETYDTDGDGGVSQEEVDGVRAERLAAFDADGDGSLSLEEYQALWLDAMRERMVDRFQAHDDDGDGQVTVEEFGEDFARMVARRDRNGDGVVNAEDMRPMPGMGRRAGRPGAETEAE